MIERKTDQKQKVNELKTFAVPFTLFELKESITINTNFPTQVSKEQIRNQALKFHSKGNIQKAAKYYKYLINQGFKDSTIFFNYGVILKSLGKLKEAESATRKAIELNPNHEDGYYNLGIILKDLGKLKEAELSNRKAIELNPDFAEAYSNLGNVLRDLGNLKQAELSTRKAIKLNPEYVEAYSNLGLILTDLDKLEDAQISLRKAIELNPKYSDAYFNLSLIELLKGNYIDGLENYEYRFKKKSPSILHGNPNTRKKSDIDLQKGEKLLVISEQGLGDTLHYMRYIPYLRNQGLKISFCAQTKLHSLIQASGIDHNPLTPDQCRKVSEGKWIPLLSISKLLGVHPNNPIITKPYIRARQELNYKWEEKLSNETVPIIGIHWQGSPELEKHGYQGRSIPLETFGTLLKKNNIKFLSLQKGYGSEQLKSCSFRKHFVACQHEIDNILDFEEHAAIISSCDLVISNDSCAATLAGGMGKKVWLLLRDIPHWTWGLERENTFWYPSMKLFRQKEKKNWIEVLDRVSIELEKMNC